MSELDWGWDEEDKAAIAEWKRKRATMTPEQELADNLRKYSTYGHAGAEMIERLASERDALTAENERLRKASNAVLDFYHGPMEAKRPDVFALLMRDLGDAL